MKALCFRHKSDSNLKDAKFLVELEKIRSDDEDNSKFFSLRQSRSNGVVTGAWSNLLQLTATGAGCGVAVFVHAWFEFDLRHEAMRVRVEAVLAATVTMLEL
ncbi:unnamed protein product [Timema podura]|uniref:Uncharacterized protein n=1 Tax=Timema podura TaxID=61482 RepID=A0ABN7PJ98_TIMPD|nr:unnamed protein product [Timema podura]